MNEKKKATVISIGIGLATIGQKYLEYHPLIAAIVVLAGAICIGAGIYWIVSQLKEEIQNLKK